MKSEFTLRDRMLRYEDIPKLKLMRRTPVIIRLDGVAFHTFTKGLNKPFDAVVIKTMQQTMQKLCESVENCVLAYTQSDEISLVLCDYKTLTTEAWYNYAVEKLVSTTAAMATLYFNQYFAVNVENCTDNARYFTKSGSLKQGYFDGRAFNLPIEEVNNYFVYRQQDAMRNSIQMAAQAKFSHNTLKGLNCDMLQVKLYEECGIDWNDYSVPEKCGTCCTTKLVPVLSGKTGLTMRKKWVIDEEIPIFSQNTDYVDKCIRFEET